jgi:hypothetical protein
MPSMQNVMITRPRLLWGERLNLIILLVFQVLAVVVFVSVLNAGYIFIYLIFWG